MSEDERYLENLRGALAQAIRLGERLQARIDAAIELLEPHDDDVIVRCVLDALEGR